MKVAILMGSASDKDKMKGAAKALSMFGIEYEARVLSAHRVPELLEKELLRMEAEGAECVIAGAGLAAHLPGVVASKTVLPVIGVPLNAALSGLDALFSIVQMPKNIPVAAVAIDSSFNAGILAVEILAVKYPELKKKLVEYRKSLKRELEENNSPLILEG
ncbi:5-(carboxyamino)imidazole ribonucleotide mutase [Spirochaetia bacterium 38H-sp]|uniref:N5-carboxyaminoimidazole ribonucleotide mutase n=1 Tax=Rarispira pelagica TaxID=3141764 RepID=A0ABU9UDX3_9SPIR